MRVKYSRGIKNVFGLAEQIVNLMAVSTLEPGPANHAVIVLARKYAVLFEDELVGFGHGRAQLVAFGLIFELH